MTNSYDVDHGLSQDAPGPLEPVEIAQLGDTLARTGNTARDQEMYAAGIRTGEENAKHNAAIRAGVPAGYKLVPIEPTPKMIDATWDHSVDRDGGIESQNTRNRRIYAAMLNAAPAAPGVSTVEDPGFPAGAIVNGRTLADRLEAYPFESQGGDLRLCSDWVEFRHCFEYLAEWVGLRAPAAGDALAPGLDLEAAAKKLAECMDYPWSHMPESGRAQMRLNAQAVIDAAHAASRPASGDGDALDAARLDWLEQHDGRFYNKDRISSIVGTGFLVAGDEQGARHQTVRAAIDAAIAAQRKGGA